MARAKSLAYLVSIDDLSGTIVPGVTHSRNINDTGLRSENEMKDSQLEPWRKASKALSSRTLSAISIRRRYNLDYAQASSAVAVDVVRLVSSLMAFQAIS